VCIVNIVVAVDVVVVNDIIVIVLVVIFLTAPPHTRPQIVHNKLQHAHDLIRGARSPLPQGEGGGEGRGGETIA